jgi:hypothetical protein
MPAEGKTRMGIDLLAKVVENDTTLIQSYVVVDHLPVRLGDGGNSTGTQGRLEPLDAAPPRDAYAWLWPIQGLVTWDEAIFIRNRRLANELMGGLAGPTFPGWSVGRARLTLNQD